jgi:hypothetical protein
MKKFFLLALISAFVTTATFAQDQQQDHKKDRTEWEQKVKTELNLTAEQIVSFDAISKEYNDKIDALLSDTTMDKDAQKQQKMSLKEEKNAKINAILTAEQQTKYKEMVDKKKEEAEKSNPTGTGSASGTGSGS